MDKINLKVPAKINLFLRVLDKRPDGYHNIDSLMQAIDLYDELTLERSDEIELVCRDLSHLPSEQNLAFRAAKLVEGMAYFPGVRVTLRKHIPVGAGLGGGSADAAFVMRGLIKLYDLQLDAADLIKKAAFIGADIPFFLGRGQARVSGIGEITKDCALPLKYKILLIKPSFSTDTGVTYLELDKYREGKFHLTNPEKDAFFYKNLADHNFVRIAKTFINDLEEVVFPRHRELSQAKDSLYNAGAFYAGMTGSGSAIFGLFSANYNVDEMRRRFIESNFSVFVCKPVILPPAN
jgi:4-diphosphocytidyl-2-C-methyl-D-erythritol kinase